MECYKNKHTLIERKEEAKKILEKFPNRIPVIVEPAQQIKKQNNPDLLLEKNKFLVPNDLTLGQFLYVVRRRLKFPAEKALFIFIGKGLPTTSQEMISLYERNKDEDGFLYATYTEENTFGN